ISNVTVKTNIDHLSNISLPAIIQVSERGMEFFFTLSKVERDKIECIDNNGVTIAKSKEEVMNHWTGLRLLLECNNESGEINIEKKLYTRLLNRVLIIASLLLTLNFVPNEKFNFNIRTNPPKKPIEEH